MYKITIFNKNGKRNIGLENFSFSLNSDTGDIELYSFGVLQESFGRNSDIRVVDEKNGKILLILKGF
ncbi:hypothetical protein C7375_10866 [Frischella perrara]|uniref:Uncharacterized protein n=1 Tax=Frischella perrara TaxID=1267021 RepID=A0A0A7RYS7_FRIPE|nr:hypothetical protein [Frischella perrara]AJA44470.1 hypothetical protein FPB0191_00639 [Frischella perrara]PWV60974.1 hypothetical protein C7375_10866 [Frischella perrara]